MSTGRRVNKVALVSNFEKALATALIDAYERESGDDAAHRFLQRILYRINRLKLFWYDDLRHYTNERSLYLRTVPDKIEASWQQWELSQLDVAALQQLDVKQALIDRAAADLEPPLSEDSRYLRQQMTEVGYRHLLAIASFDGLVEASQLSRREHPIACKYIFLSRYYPPCPPCPPCSPCSPCSPQQNLCKFGMISSFSDPEGTINQSREKGYYIYDFVVVPLPFGYYSSEPKVKNTIKEMRKNKKAFYSDKI